jgi:hypothetical protein
MNGFAEEQILELPVGIASFDFKLDVMEKLTKAIILKCGKPPAHVRQTLFNAGDIEANMRYY